MNRLACSFLVFAFVFCLLATPIVLASLISKQAEQKAGSASLGFERKAGDTRPRAGSTYALV